MKVTVERDKSADHVFTVSVDGEVDIYSAPILKDKLIPLTETEGGRVTLNLSKTAYIDSTALGVIVSALKSSNKHHCAFWVEGMTPRVKRLFKITGLMEILKRKELPGGIVNE